MDSRSRLRRIGKIVLGIFILFAALTAAFHPLNHDEIEHIHSAWNIQQGLRPYADFFEHHHPLFWYLLVPVLWVFGETTAAILASRFLMLGLTLLMARTVAALAARIFRTPFAPLLSVLILFSHVLFVIAGVQVRPDVPQVLLALMAILEMVKFEEDGRPRRLVAAAFLSSLSFVFLQKALFFLLPAAAAWLWRRRDPGAPRVGRRTLAAGAAAFLFPLGLLLAFQAATGAFPDYIASNWFFNLNRGSIISPVTFFLVTLVENPVHYVMIINVCVLALLGHWRRRIPAVLPAVIFISGLIPFLVGSPYTQYFLLPSALLAVLGGGFLAEVLPALRKRRALVAVIAVFLILPPVISFGIRTAVGNRGQLEIIDAVVRGTAPADRVHDGQAEFNAFRRDLHYFWFTYIVRRPEARLPARLQARRADFDEARLVRELRPAFTSDVGIDPSDPGFRALYGPTAFKKPRYPANLYRRLNPGEARPEKD